MKHNAWQTILNVLPPPLYQALQETVQNSEQVTELHIRCGQNAQIFTSNARFFLDEKYGFRADEKICSRILENAAQHSLFNVQHQMQQGFISLPCGVRVGLAGRFFRQDGRIGGVMPVTSFCFRAAHEHIGAAQQLMQQIRCAAGYASTLVVSPPGMGKTSVLRDMARIASLQGMRTAVLDERAEISGWQHGGCGFDLGPCCDVLYDIGKSEGVMFCIRTLASEVIVCDELGAQKDAWALQEAVRCGVTIFASAHAADMEDLLSRPMLRSCLRAGGFSYAAFLRSDQKGMIREVMKIGG